MTRVLITSAVVGVAHMQVCAVIDAADQEIIDVCNLENPSGTSAGWARVCRGPDDFWGNVGPVPCADDPARVHLLVAC